MPRLPAGQRSPGKGKALPSCLHRIVFTAPAEAACLSSQGSLVPQRCQISPVDGLVVHGRNRCLILFDYQPPVETLFCQNVQEQRKVQSGIPAPKLAESDKSPLLVEDHVFEVSMDDQMAKFAQQGNAVGASSRSVAEVRTPPDGRSLEEVADLFLGLANRPQVIVQSCRDAVAVAIVGQALAALDEAVKDAEPVGTWDIR